MLNVDDKGLVWYGRKNIGQLSQIEDGTWQYFPRLVGGYWPGYLMRQLADYVDALNEDWYRELEEACKG